MGIVIFVFFCILKLRYQFKIVLFLISSLKYIIHTLLKYIVYIQSTHTNTQNNTFNGESMLEPLMLAFLLIPCGPFLTGPITNRNFGTINIQLNLNQQELVKKLNPRGVQGKGLLHLSQNFYKYFYIYINISLCLFINVILLIFSPFDLTIKVI